MYSKIAFASSTRVRQRCRSSNSVCIRPQNAAATALSYGSPTLPNDGSRLALRARSVKVQEVNRVP
jgi:hypothetical protein